jgi:hypothetical protein
MTGVPPGTDKTERHYDAVADFFRGLRPDLGSPLRSLTAPSISPSLMSGMSGMSGMSRRAVRARPIEARHIIRLREILQPPGEEREMFTRDHQIYGFAFNDWLHQNVAMFPIESMRGKKRTFGPHIKGNKDEKHRHFIFTVTRKASLIQIDALLTYIDEKLPKLFQMTTYLKRKKWDKIKGIQYNHDLHELITTQLKSKSKVTVKLSW